jgi:hypothetical protein
MRQLPGGVWLSLKKLVPIRPNAMTPRFARTQKTTKENKRTLERRKKPSDILLIIGFQAANSDH